MMMLPRVCIVGLSGCRGRRVSSPVVSAGADAARGDSAEVGESSPGAEGLGARVVSMTSVDLGRSLSFFEIVPATDRRRLPMDVDFWIGEFCEARSSANLQERGGRRHTGDVGLRLKKPRLRSVCSWLTDGLRGRGVGRSGRKSSTSSVGLSTIASVTLHSGTLILGTSRWLAAPDATPEFHARAAASSVLGVCGASDVALDEVVRVGESAGMLEDEESAAIDRPRCIEIGALALVLSSAGEAGLRGERGSLRVPGAFAYEPESFRAVVRLG